MNKTAITKPTYNTDSHIGKSNGIIIGYLSNNKSFFIIIKTVYHEIN